ncbi:hypothetical protein PM082_014377 [Marasmius tenuissimus]|nr:hypothetical protein PM082_014377 [Marasmius tenuissimus]
MRHPFDALPFSVAAGVASYIVFKRTESINSENLFASLLVVPLLISFCFDGLLGSKSTIIPTAATIVLVYYTTILLCTLIYRISPFHPLAGYPGPLVCRITKWRSAWAAKHGKLHLLYSDLHERYGDVVRVGPNELSFRSVEAITPIMGMNGISKGPFWDGRFPASQARIGYPIVALRDQEEHHRRRTVWNKAFSSGAIKEYEALVKTKTEELIGRLKEVVQQKGPEKGGSEIDVGTWMGYYTYDLMTDFVFSGGSNMLTHGDPEGLWNEIRGGLEKTMFFSHLPWLGQLFHRLPVRYFGGLRAFRKTSYERAMKRKTEGPKAGRKDLYYYLLDEGNPDAKPSGPQVISDASAAVLAGADTTSTTVTMIVYYLTTRPVIYERLRKEIEDLGDEWDDTGAQVKLSYLNAVINEVLRLWPVLLSGSQRGIKAGEEGRIVCGRYISPGTNVTIPPYAVHRDPRNFSPCPDGFVPERWLQDESKRNELEPGLFGPSNLSTGVGDYRHNLQAFIPFSYGPANCVGKNLALMEMRMVICALVKSFMFREVVQAGDVGEESKFSNKHDHSNRKKGGLENTVTDYYTMQLGKLVVSIETARNSKF